MSVVFHCPACGFEHPSRVRGPNKRWMEIFLDSCGEVLERCPRTGTWVRLATSLPAWVPDHAGQDAAAPLVTRPPR